MNNTKKLIVIGTLLAGLTAPAAEDKLHHVPDNLNDIRLLCPAAAARNHILVANVGGAVDEKDFGFLVTVVAGRLQLNVWTNSIPSSPVASLLGDPSVISRDFGDKAKVVVFLEETGDADPYLVSPGRWCRVNLKGLKAGAADRQVILDRQAKAIMRGVAYACGGGATLDGRSVTHSSAFTKDGFDKVGITVTPDSFFPMLEVLRVVGGSEMLSPAVSVE